MSEIERLDNDIVKVTVHITGEAFKAAEDKAYHKNAAHFNVPGFRKGKAPKSVIKNCYGPMAFFDDAFDLCWAEPYDAAIAEHDLKPVDRPSVELKSFDENAGIDFIAEVQLEPTVTLGQYKGIEIVKQNASVSDEEVENALKAEQENQARYVDVERPIENGDRIVLDYAGTVDGVAFEGGTAQDQNLDIGSGMFIPGFEEQLIGVSVGEDKNVEVTFPEEYHAKELAGKAAVFACKVKAVQTKELPELDDEFIKDISEFDTVQDWKENKKAEILKIREQNAKTAMENEAIAKVSENAECKVPDCMIDRQVNYMIQDMTYRMQASGISMEDYFKYVGTDMEKMKAMYRPDASARVKNDLVIAAVEKAENITADENEINDEISSFAEQNGMKKEDIEKNFSENDRAYFAESAAIRKTIRFIMDNCVYTDSSAESKAE